MANEYLKVGFALAEGVAGDAFWDAGAAGGFTDRLLQPVLVEVVASYCFLHKYPN